VRDTLNLIHDLSERGVGVRNFADPIKVDSSNPDDPMAQLAVVVLALFGQMERTYAMERAAHVPAVATAKHRRIGRPVLVNPAKLHYAAHRRDSGDTIAETVAKTGIPRSSLYRHLPPRAAPTVTAGGDTDEDRERAGERRGRCAAGGAQRGGESKRAAALARAAPARRRRRAADPHHTRRRRAGANRAALAVALPRGAY